MHDLAEYTRNTGRRARAASRDLAGASGQQKIDWLHRTADLLLQRADQVITANTEDLKRGPEFGLSSAAIDRLRLDEDRLQGIATALREVAALPDPVGEIIEGSRRPNGLLVSRVRVPLGVVFFIYESRPNVTMDAAALCVKSGNAVILRGGKEAFHSNTALHGLLQESLQASGLPADAVQLVNTTDRAAVGEFLRLSEFIDVTIPRGGKSLIERVAAEATMPVIKHFDGNCHVYVDRAADLQMASDIIVNAKCQRPGVCNAAETLLVHADIAAEFLPAVAGVLRERGVTLHGCERTCEVVSGCEPATDDDWGTEYLSLDLAVKVVDSLNAAIEHINNRGSHHTDAIVTSNYPAAETFCRAVDSSAVVVNASTRFNDGGELGLGAEIGISTDKFHARGPCGLRELTSYKYIVQGTGQIRT